MVSNYIYYEIEIVRVNSECAELFGNSLMQTINIKDLKVFIGQGNEGSIERSLG